ncbi:MAG: alpha/beta hydrolase [Saprospiraceae bacterium]|nr:alpha/beta hydrolase [Saprospiraceae bacterium]
MTIYFKFLFSAFFIFTSQLSYSQNTGITEKQPFKLGVIETIESTALSETRILNIYLPDGYIQDGYQAYPVVYVLDGSANEDFVHIVGLVQFMNMYDLMPKSIVVGIANVDRYRDFTHVSTDSLDLIDLPTSGGSEKFIRFLETEVQPLINNNYLTDGHQTIIGQSLGGLLASEILFKKPALFDDYIIVSPSLWWDQQSMINDVETYLQANPGLKKKVFVSLGTEHPVMHQVADKLVAALREAKNQEFTVFYETFPEENHATILHRAVYRAFELLNEKPTED